MAFIRADAISGRVFNLVLPSGSMVKLEEPAMTLLYTAWVVQILTNGAVVQR